MEQWTDFQEKFVQWQGNDDTQKRHNAPTVIRKAAHCLFIQVYFCTLTPT